jgi:hypothetical protein
MTAEEPGPGVRVTDEYGRVWINTADEDSPGAANWELEEAMARGFFEPESWTRVCQYLQG